MAFGILLAPGAVDQFKSLPAHIRSRVRDALEAHLRHEPKKTSRSRIKRLRGIERPQYRLRVDEIRVFYDVKETTVEVLAVVSKDDAQAWLEHEGTPSKEGSSGRSQG